MLDWALDALAAPLGKATVDTVAVNVSYKAQALVDHLASSARLVEISHEPVPLGTAGAVGALRGWLDGRAALIVNADTWHTADLASFAAGWDGERVRILTPTPGLFGPRSGVVASILPWSEASRLTAEPGGLWEAVWRRHVASGTVDTVYERAPVVDCATPADYLRANLTWSGGRSVVAAETEVLGTLERCVVWSGARVAAGEHLRDAIRTPTHTVLVR